MLDIIRNICYYDLWQMYNYCTYFFGKVPLRLSYGKRKFIMINIAFVGFRHGHINGFYKLASENPEVKIVAAFEENAEARAAAEKSLGVVFTHDSYEALLAEKDIDVVAIGDYFGIRGSRAIEALKAGKHVYADKPLCTSLDELKEIKKLSSEKGLKVGCMLDVRYAPWVETAKAFIEKGNLGKINNISFGGQHPLLWGSRAGWYFEEGKHGGTINDIAIHGIDILEYITGLSVEKVVAARCWNAYATECPIFEDCGQFMCEMTGGCGLMADVSYAAPDTCGYRLNLYWRFNIWGEKGVMEITHTENTVKVALNGTAGFVTLPNMPATTDDCLKVFLRELAGQKTAIDTASTLAVSEKTLLIQAAADNK